MKFDVSFWTTPTGHLLLAAVVLLGGASLVFWQKQRRQTVPLAHAPEAAPPSLPKTMVREGRRFEPPTGAVLPFRENASALPAGDAAAPLPMPVKKQDKPRVPPLALIAAGRFEEPANPPLFAPYGRLIACETVITVESSRLDTPVIGLVTEDVWHDGRLVIPAGAEVHGRASIDRSRERIAAQGAWVIVWRTPDAANGTELVVQGLALDHDVEPGTSRFGEHDGSAGLRGQVLRTDNYDEVKLFAAAFLGGATAALQETRNTATPLGESVVPVTTARNAALAGASAVLRDYAQTIRESIARDGVYVRVPAGKPFYLYVTQTIDRGRGRRAALFQSPSNYAK